MDEKKLSLTEKPKWEIFVATKLDNAGIAKEVQPQIIRGIEVFLPMMMIVIPCIIAGFFSKE